MQKPAPSPVRASSRVSSPEEAAGRRQPYEASTPPLFGDVSTGRKELRARGASRKVNGSVVLPATIHDFGNGRDYKVDLGMVPSGQSWKVNRIANMDKLVSRLQKEAAE